VISALKLCYLCHMLRKLTAETDVKNELAVHEFCQISDILDHVQMVSESWKKHQTKQMSGCCNNSSRCSSLL
jgi:hypothetical protein